ncbi:hypothetical protein G7066_10380 [Leucobacter coleopterorum]|uniref:Uncharacterized protein n=1 Tax=Leucobacter coleopterorum TaxID=2714933 RepID=A0ABX6JZ58_9MICO|nr:hypothetical protein [Leucobacter coleopterorum]QIM18893.1 hypothetical protein G7066_10380 [Leucobacter coleopterorum]
MFTMFPMEVALTLGVIFFVISWVYPRSLVALPGGEHVDRRRLGTLVWAGIAGPLFVVAVATVTTTIAYSYGFPDPSGFAGWWRRPAPLLAAALVVAVAAVALRGEVLPTPTERAISPRRRWWSFTSPPLLWGTASIAALLALTTTWQIAIGRSAPPGANQFGMAPVESDLPVFMALYGDYGFIPGAGWPNHLPTLIVLLLTAAVFSFTLGADANRAIFARSTAVEVRREREATARLLTLITLGGLAATLGAVWSFTGFIGEIIIMMESHDGSNNYLGGDVAQAVVGTSYQGIAPFMHKGGYLVQGLGVALLLRVTVDTMRSWVGIRSDQRRRASEAREAADSGVNR